MLFLGRHEERKGLGVLLEAFDRLRRPAGGAGGRADRPILWVAGDGPQTAALRRRHPEAPDLLWLGVLTEEEKVRRLVAADVLCAPSLGGESFGMVLLEAMAARAAVVASDIDGYREAAGGHAVLVPPGDAAALAEALAGGRSASPAASCEPIRTVGRDVAGRAVPALGRPLVDGAPGRVVRGRVPGGRGPAPGLSGRTLLGPWMLPNRAARRTAERDGPAARPVRGAARDRERRPAGEPRPTGGGGGSSGRSRNRNRNRNRNRSGSSGGSRRPVAGAGGSGGTRSGGGPEWRGGSRSSGGGDRGLVERPVVLVGSGRDGPPQGSGTPSGAGTATPAVEAPQAATARPRAGRAARRPRPSGPTAAGRSGSAWCPGW